MRIPLLAASCGKVGEAPGMMIDVHREKYGTLMLENGNGVDTVEPKHMGEMERALHAAFQVGRALKRPDNGRCRSRPAKGFVDPPPKDCWG